MEYVPTSADDFLPDPVDGSGGFMTVFDDDSFEFDRLDIEDAGPGIRAGMWVLVSFSALFLAGRIYCKRARQSRLYWDDWVMINAWLALLANVIFTHVSIDLGYGKHSHMVDPLHLDELLITGLLSVTFSLIGQAWSKTSFAMTLLRFTTGKIRMFILVNIVLMNLLFGLAALFFWVQCTPIEKTWNLWMPGTCWDPRVNVVFNIIVGGYSGIMDLVLSALPWKVVKDLNMTAQQKVGVALAMNLGVFAATASFIKCSYLPTLMYGDFSFNGAHLVIWAAAEIAVTIMATSIPEMRRLLQNKRAMNTTASSFNSFETTLHRPQRQDEEWATNPAPRRLKLVTKLERIESVGSLEMLADDETARVSERGR